MEKKVVSIVIPVYNTEQYLKECMDSALQQDYPFLEIILVDDGSQDGSPILCDQYAGQFANVQVIHQTNSGLGLARNAGMAASSGDYIFFLDSDDCIDTKKAISRLVKQAEKEEADIVTGSFRRFNSEMISKVNYHHLQHGSYTKSVDFRFKGFYMYGHLAYNWGKLYRKSFLEKYDLKCCSYPFTQDKAHNMACCAYNPVYAFIEESVYLYRVNEDSVSFRYKENFIPVWVSIASDFHKFLKRRNLNDNYGDLTAFHIFFGSFFLVKQELQFKKHGILESVEMLKQYGNIPFVRWKMKELARGNYVSAIKVRSWKIVIQVSSILFVMRCYWIFACGIAFLRKLEIDKKITEARYKEKNENKLGEGLNYGRKD